jgi:hypothetical protein
MSIAAMWKRHVSQSRAARSERVATACALLDAPDSRAMRLVPIVVSLGTSLRATGLAGGDRPISEPEFDLLLTDGHARAIEHPVPADTPAPLCAAWLGLEFARACEDADAPELPFDRRVMTRVPKLGWYLIERPAAVFAALDGWYRAAFVAAVERRSRPIAELLPWVDPNRDDTRAALYLTGTTAERDRELTWWARLERDAGQPVASPEALIARIDTACARVFLDWLPPTSAAMDVGPWGRLGIATRCAERLAPPVDPYPDDPGKSPVAHAIRIARDAALRGRPADGREVERTRIALLEQVHRPWQTARISAHVHPSALHAVESALFYAERIEDAGYAGQATLALEHGVSEIAYPELTWLPLPALWAHFSARSARAVHDDTAWLESSSRGEAVPGAFFERPLWPEGPPVGWDDHVARFHARLFGSGRRNADDIAPMLEL